MKLVVAGLVGMVCLAVASVPARAQQSASPPPVPDTPAAAPLGTSLEFFKDELKKPPSKLKPGSSQSVATYRVQVHGDYRAEFLARMPSIFELSEEDKKLARLGGKGGGFDPAIAWKACKKVARSLEARRARAEVRQVLEALKKAEAQQEP